MNARTWSLQESRFQSRYFIKVQAFSMVQPLNLLMSLMPTSVSSSNRHVPKCIFKSRMPTCAWQRSYGIPRFVSRNLHVGWQPMRALSPSWLCCRVGHCWSCLCSHIDATGKHGISIFLENRLQKRKAGLEAVERKSWFYLTFPQITAGKVPADEDDSAAPTGATEHSVCTGASYKRSFWACDTREHVWFKATPRAWRPHFISFVIANHARHVQVVR